MRYLLSAAIAVACVASATSAMAVELPRSAFWNAAEPRSSSSSGRSPTCGACTGRPTVPPATATV